MKLSLRWAQQFSSTDFFKDPDLTINKIGSQLGAVDEVINYSDRYDGVVVVKIVRCEPHPDADKLKICWIDDGGINKDVKRTDERLVQVVCGGPNAREGIFTAWIPPKVIVPNSWDTEKFTIEAREIRGIVSYGMLASPSELAISDEHSGIIEINSEDIGSEPVLGQALIELYALNDIVVDIENKMFTHRPDLFGTLGLSRELTGIFGDQFTSPSWYNQDNADHLSPKAFEQLDLEIKNQVDQLVPRFCSIALSDVIVKPSPYWLQSILTKIGVKPINNIVDITNYIMYLTAQPLHAFDYDKVKAKGSAGLEARFARQNEQIQLLGGKTIKLSEENIVIANPAGEPMALAGIMGGSDTEVDENTKNIIFECATFDMYSVRKTAMQFGLFTDAVTRFSKGQSPLQNLTALNQAVKMAIDITGAKVASNLIDLNRQNQGLTNINVDKDFINSRLGLELSEQDILKTLNSTELSSTLSGGKISVKVPFWRTDIHIPEDIVEEVGRLVGYDKLPVVLPKRDLKPASPNSNIEFKDQLRQILTKFGANEVLTYSFVNTRLIESSGQDSSLCFNIRNALSPDLQHYRMSLSPSLLEKVHLNSKLGFKTLTMFELGKVYLKDQLVDEVPDEHQRLSVVSIKASYQPAYYNSKQILVELLDRLNIVDYDFEPLQNCSRTLSQAWTQASQSFEPSRSAVLIVGSEIVGLIGEPTIKLKKALKLSNNTSYFEVDTDILNNLSKQVDYLPINKFPSSTQDITFKVDAKNPYKIVRDQITSNLNNESKTSGYKYKLTPVDIFARPEDQSHISYSFRIELWHPEKTLVTSEFNKILDNIALELKEGLHAERV